MKIGQHGFVRFRDGSSADILSYAIREGTTAWSCKYKVIEFYTVENKFICIHLNGPKTNVFYRSCFEIDIYGFPKENLVLEGGIESIGIVVGEEPKDERILNIGILNKKVRNLLKKYDLDRYEELFGKLEERKED